MTPHPVKWVPHWAAKKVEASHTPFDGTSVQKIHARCLDCGEELNRHCDSGNARHWITTFALTHRRLHPY
jgi:hypothetical protein